MRIGTAVAWGVMVVAVGLSGCGKLDGERGRVQLWWPAQDMLISLSPQQARVDAYRLSGRVGQAGSVALPTGDCFSSLHLDSATGRLWVTGEGSGLVIDAHSMEVLAEWKGIGSPVDGVAPVIVARVASDSEAVCAATELGRT